MIFIIDIDCCVFFGFKGPFFLLGWDCAAEAWPSRVRWGLAGWIVFFVGWSGSSGTVYWVYCLSRVWQELTLKYIEIYWNHCGDCWGDPCAVGDPHPRWGVRRRCRGAKVSRKSVGRFQGSGMCMLYVICTFYFVYMVFWFEHGLILVFLPFKQNANFPEQKQPMIRVLSWQGAAPKRAEPLQYGDGFWRRDFPRLGPGLFGEPQSHSCVFCGALQKSNSRLYLHVLWMNIGYLPSFFRQIYRVEGTW